MGLTKGMQENLELDPMDWKAVSWFFWSYQDYNLGRTLSYSLRQAFQYAYYTSNLDGNGYKNVFVSIPMLNSWVPVATNDTLILSCYITLDDTSDQALIDELTAQLVALDLEVILVNGGLGGPSAGMVRIKHLLDWLFDSIILVVMFLCFFALSANMSANLYEQAKEIGLLRAMGFRSVRIKMLYFYEAFTLVLASSLMGVFIGVVVGYTMTLQ